MKEILKTDKFEDRREHERMAVRWPITILTDKGSVKGEAKNLCATGLYIECGRRLLLHDTFPIYIGVDKASVFIRGKVIWLRMDNGNEEFPSYGMGISFRM